MEEIPAVGLAAEPEATPELPEKSCGFAVPLSLVNFLFGALIMLLVIQGYHPEKHTGQVFVCGHSPNWGLILRRPNKEIFVMRLDNDPGIGDGVEFDDIVYVDKDQEFRHFIKAKLHGGNNGK